MYLTEIQMSESDRYLEKKTSVALGTSRHGPANEAPLNATGIDVAKNGTL
jgi:hypothetical protein